MNLLPCPSCGESVSTDPTRETVCPRCQAPVTPGPSDPYATCAAAGDPYATCEVSTTPAAIACCAGPTIPGYEILGELGRGGMGVVYKARQQGLKRRVALKMILSGDHAGADQRARFCFEAEACAQLEHPSIVKIYEVSEFEGRPYLALEYIDGGSLAQKLIGTPLPANEAVSLLEKVAQAIQAAHAQGIVHRDLKPANILLRNDGTPKVTDFGLAKRLDGVGQTRTGDLMGTPAYMAPEQAAGKHRLVGPRSDVYALGAMLYEMLTGRPPFRGETVQDTLLQVLQRDPVPPCLLNPRVHHDLQTICLKCLEKEPGDRYASAAALANDLQRYLDGESISARSFNLLDRLSRTLKRSQLDAEFHSWGNMILLFAGIVFLIYSGLTLVHLLRLPFFWLYAATGVKFVLMGLVFWRWRSRLFLPSSAAERQLLSIWIAFLTASALCGEISHHLVGREKMYDGFVFPYVAILSGVCLFVMGSSYWGRCYAFGVAFFVLAGVMLWDLRWAVLEFGLLWTFCLVCIGLRLRRLGREAETAVAASPPADGPNSKVTESVSTH